MTEKKISFICPEGNILTGRRIRNEFQLFTVKCSANRRCHAEAQRLIGTEAERFGLNAFRLTGFCTKLGGENSKNNFGKQYFVDPESGKSLPLPLP